MKSGSSYIQESRIDLDLESRTTALLDMKSLIIGFGLRAYRVNCAIGKAKVIVSSDRTPS